MTTTGRTTAVGVFTERALAESAIEKLHRAGFTDDQIGFIAREHDAASRYDNDDETNVPGAAAGAVGGGIVGGVIGAVTSLLIPGLGPVLATGFLVATISGAAIGAVAGGFAGSLMHMGVPEEEARYYQEQLANGRAIVTVNAPDRYQDAVSIMRQAGAFDAEVREDMPPTTEPNAGMYNADVSRNNLPPVMVPPVGYVAGTTGTPAGFVNPVQPAAGYAPVIPPATDEYTDKKSEDTEEPVYSASNSYNTNRRPENLKDDEQRDSYPRANENETVYNNTNAQNDQSSYKDTTTYNDQGAYTDTTTVYNNQNTYDGDAELNRYNKDAALTDTTTPTEYEAMSQAATYNDETNYKRNVSEKDRTPSNDYERMAKVYENYAETDSKRDPAYATTQPQYTENQMQSASNQQQYVDNRQQYAENQQTSTQQQEQYRQNQYRKDQTNRRQSNNQYDPNMNQPQQD